MCEIWEEIKQKGIIEGEARGEARGEMKGMVKSIQKLMIKKDYTLEEALNFFDIPGGTTNIHTKDNIIIIRYSESFEGYNGL
ncbi:MAG: hypothetical protein ACLRNS_17515 [Coprobacillus cateniformis]|uniref:hypothetical protein n=1 Tax=Coprobacillus cateniformis TaxID=100884 RepID=UPI0039A13024